jgi:hypothetical protein
MQGHCECVGSNLFVQQMRQQAQDKVRGLHLSSSFKNYRLCLKTVVFRNYFIRNFPRVGGVQAQLLFLVKIDCRERLAVDGYVYSSTGHDLQCSTH